MIPTKSDLVDYVKDEQESIWFDFYTAILSAHDGVWSVDCENKLNRLCRSISLVGPIHWGKIQKALLDSKIYNKVLAELGWSTPTMPSDLGEFLAFPYPTVTIQHVRGHIRREEWK